MTGAFEDYLGTLKKNQAAEKSEKRDRSALEGLLNAFAPEDGGIVQHEPKPVTGKGAPDFRIIFKGMTLGYTETKKTGENLDKILKSNQIARYKSLSDNILLTDYLRFIWIRKGRVLGDAALCGEDDLTAPRFRLSDKKSAAVEEILKGFFSAAPDPIGRAQELAPALAVRSRLLRNYLGRELVRQKRNDAEGKLHGLYEMFRNQIFSGLTLREFANSFAQMLAYGLFLARLNADNKEEVTLHNAREHVPDAFQLIRELVDFLAELEKPQYRDIRWVVDEVLAIINNLDLAAVMDDLAFRQRKAVNRRVQAKSEDEHRLFERDPFIYFYEDYLKAYDPDMRKGRGVYYTPPPVVNFIVRAVDDILKDSLGINKGLADYKRVTVLDFACGTGTFLLEIFQRIFENIGGADSGNADLFIRDHFLKNIYGFEYLIAPYTVAHLKLSQYLREKSYVFGENERLQVYLTNTLEPIEPQANHLLSAVSAEVEAAQSVKDEQILVITGNPPYAGHSKNKGDWITQQVRKYREEFPELQKPGQGKWLQDDYVKFIRFAQIKMDAAEQGVVGVITNHSWIDNPTFKGMRKSLMETFDQIYVLDLHGSTKKKESAPDGGKDENIFDIEQGVAVSLFVKGQGLKKSVRHADFWGKRSAKYGAAVESSLNSIEWKDIRPEAPDWLFMPYDAERAREYRQYWSLPEIFSPMGAPAPGIVTTHDEFAVSFSAAEAAEKVQKFLKTQSEKEARSLYRLCSQKQWSYKKAKSELPDVNLASSAVHLAYRPFDARWTVWDRNVAVHRRERVMKHMIEGGNLGIFSCRQVKSGRSWQHAFVTNSVSESSFISNRTSEIGYCFPLYIEKSENFSVNFRKFIDSRYKRGATPEEIFGYIYAVLHAPFYRERYAEFLRADFPRIPFPAGVKDFLALSRLGSQLADAHLQRRPVPVGLGAYTGKGGHTVEQVTYSEVEECVLINKAQKFENIPKNVWEFRIGGYQVLAKYLKARRDRELSLDEIEHVGDIACILAFTAGQMSKIDKAYVKAFPEQT